MSKIIQLTAENVKRLHAVQITPNGHMVVIGGKNGQGKTSVLDAIAMALGGADEIPSMPVRRGEGKARVILDLGDIIVRRTFTTKDGETTSTVIVENKDKMRASAPQAILDRLTGKVTFDPLAFASMEPGKQAATLKRLVGLDLSALDAERLRIYNERTLVNRDHDRESARVGLMPQHPEAPATEQSVTEIVAERDAATAHNAKRATLDIAFSDAGAAVTANENVRISIAQEIETLEARLIKLREDLKTRDAKIVDLKQAKEAARLALESFVPADISPINLKLANVTRLNDQVRANRSRVAALAALASIKSKSDALTAQIERIDEKKAQLLSAIKFPVAGLSFGESGVLFNGVPFDQASAAERLRVSVAIAAAMNPKLRVMLVRDASLLDEDGLAQLAKLAEEFDLQVWAERVGKGAECSVIIEDGAVLGASADAGGKETA